MTLFDDLVQPSGQFFLLVRESLQRLVYHKYANYSKMITLLGTLGGAYRWRMCYQPGLPSLVLLC